MQRSGRVQVFGLSGKLVGRRPSFWQQQQEEEEEEEPFPSNRARLDGKGSLR